MINCGLLLTKYQCWHKIFYGIHSVWWRFPIITTINNTIFWSTRAHEDVSSSPGTIEDSSEESIRNPRGLRDPFRYVSNFVLQSGVQNQTSITRVSAGTILKSTYGIDMQSKEGCAINELAIEANSALVSLGVNGLTAADLVPICGSLVHLVD